MRYLTLAVLLALLSVVTWADDDAALHEPTLLLTAKLSKRLKRDKERQTPRWVNFENRVKNVPESPERGFELALYYAVTGDADRAHEAVEWVMKHAGAVRQRALVLDWCAQAMTKEERAGLLLALTGQPSASSFQARRDCLFADLAAGRDASSCGSKDLKTEGLVLDPAELYAACEYFFTMRANGADDQRRDDPQFFQHLPVEFLLARKPAEVEHPDWQSHVAALALVSLDPNLEASQFLQGWAIEDRQTLHDGPGVAYELLWADPYLPGIAYQNLDPWFYEQDGGQLFARSDWNSTACWISISAQGLQQQGCPAGWQSQVASFGSLKLMPSLGRCVEIAHQDMRQAIVVWKLKPGEKMNYRDGKEILVQADAAGMWHPGSNVEGKVCEVR